MWKGRFQQTTAKLLSQYSESISFDWRLYPHDIAGLHRPLRGPARGGHHHRGGAGRHRVRPAAIGAEIEAGAFQFDPAPRRHPHEHRGRAHPPHRRRRREAPHRPQPQRPGRARPAALPARRDATPSPRLVRALQRSLVDLGLAPTSTSSSPATRISSARSRSSSRIICWPTSRCSSATRPPRRSRASASTSCRSAPAPSPARPSSSTATSSRSELGFSAITQNSMDAVSDRDFACELLAAHRHRRHASLPAERGPDPLGLERVRVHHASATPSPPAPASCRRRKIPTWPN